MKIFNNFKKINFFSLKAKAKTGINPVFYWKFFVFIFIFGLLAAFLLNLYFFWYFNKIESLNVEITEQKIKKDKLENILRELDEREAELLRLMKEGTTIIEP